jgi:dienelactone hydrolase
MAFPDLSKALGALAAGLDAAVLSLALRRSAAPPRPVGEGDAAALAEVTAFYAARAGELFAAPPPAAPEQRAVRELPGGEVVDLSWESRYEPLHPGEQRRYASRAENRLARARLFRHDAPRPAVICVHGYGGGHLPIEEHLFSARWLYSLGLDVALLVLPFHGLRAARLGAPLFPNPARVSLTNEAFGQAIFDLRALVGYLLEREASAVGVLGMSLGGYTAALAATVEPGLDFAVPLVPFADFAELVWAHGESSDSRRAAEGAGITRQALSEAFAAHTPTRRRPALPGERVLVIAGDSDRITPRSHAERLRTHFGPGPFHVFAGGHLLQIGHGGALRAMARFLNGLDILPR